MDLASTFSGGGAGRMRRGVRFALVVATGFTLLTFALTSTSPAWERPAAWARTFGISLAYSVFITLAIAAMFALARRLFVGPGGPQSLPPLQRRLYWWGTPAVALTVALPIASVVAARLDGVGPSPQLHASPAGAVAFTVLVIAGFYGYFGLRAARERAERQATEAQLKLLQGQIEPHFLFNTLANVVGLMEVDTPRARRMLESFVDYLRSSLGGLRRENHTLGDEIDLVTAYLGVIQVRMEDRLRVEVDVPEALRRGALPALSVQPLVENAILHGLEPAIDGGTVRIVARLDGRTLLVTVEDDGRGLQAASTHRGGTRTALPNLRERLAQRHGAAAALTLEERAPHGVRATLRLPWIDVAGATA